MDERLLKTATEATQVEPRLRWCVDVGCGARRIWKLLTHDNRLLAVVQHESDWWVWLPGERRPLGHYCLLRDAKMAALSYCANSKAE